MMLSLALAGSPHHLILPHGFPRLASGGHPVFSRLTPGYLGGKL